MRTAHNAAIGLLKRAKPISAILLSEYVVFCKVWVPS